MGDGQMDEQLLALSRAWLVTMVAISLFVASMGIRDVWDRDTLDRAVENVLLSNAL
jgi:hypothetical protein